MDHIICVTKTILLFFLCSLLAGPHGLANANLQDITSLDREPPYNICSNSSTNHVNENPFQNNLKSLFNSLSLNASVSKFSSSSFTRNDSDSIYGLYMCLNYKYTTLDDCKNCIDSASNDITRLCSSNKEALVWEDSCLLRYSDENFFGKLDISGNVPRANYKNVTEPERYKSVVTTVLSDLIKKAAFDLANNMSATDEAPFTNMDTVYALVQCARDLSPDDCNSCLRAAATEILTCCYFSRGARVYSRSCFLRYELYDFINGANESPPGGNQPKGKGNQRKTLMIVIIAVPVTFLQVVFLAFIIYYLAKMKRTQNRKSEVIRHVQIHKVGDSNNTDFSHGHIQGRDDLKAQEFHIDLKTIHVATDNFSDSNMLGQGGFGPVYKGILSDGKEVAVKRLSSYSEQGNDEFTNEVLLIVKLQHKNLVRLLGFCVEGEEKLLVYEYMPNSSLDRNLYDPSKREQLIWSKRIHIINGIAKGILYLHVDSRLRIIHRDLKASNILLDSDMNPKISDFGLARIFAGSEGETSTVKIVGTYGYMAPEYAMEGLYSIKSDVFSFGVLLLEILSGRKNAGFHQSKHAPSLLAYAWQLWNEGKALELMDPLLTDTCSPEEFLRCIHIGLLCVQEDAFDRPTMSSVVTMLKGETVTLRQPERPPLFLGKGTNHREINDTCSVNGLTVSDALPR